MKVRFILISLLFLGLLPETYAQGGGGELILTSPAEDGTGPIIYFAEPEFDHGSVVAGDTVYHTFVFENRGDADLIVEHVKPPCVCTTAKWTTDPVPPGKTGEISVKFDSADKSGEQMKYLTVIYNGEPPIEQILLMCRVIEAAENKPEPKE